VVDSIEPTGPAAVAGIQRGDVIQEVNHQPVRSADELRNALAKTGAGPALFLINRRGQAAFFAIRPRSYPGDARFRGERSRLPLLGLLFSVSYIAQSCSHALHCQSTQSLA